MIKARNAKQNQVWICRRSLKETAMSFDHPRLSPSDAKIHPMEMGEVILTIVARLSSVPAIHVLLEKRKNLVEIFSELLKAQNANWKGDVHNGVAFEHIDQLLPIIERFGDKGTVRGYWLWLENLTSTSAISPVLCV
jgi:hypothetical protein